MHKSVQAMEIKLYLWVGLMVMAEGVHSLDQLPRLSLRKSWGRC